MPTLSELAARWRGGHRDAFMAESTPWFLMVSTAQGTGTTGLTTDHSGVARPCDPTEITIQPLRKRPEANSFAGMITFGRVGNNDVVVDHTGVSKFHAYLRQEEQGWTVQDANSKNGSFLNGVPMEPERAYPFGPGSELRLGDVASVQLRRAETVWALLQDPSGSGPSE